MHLAALLLASIIGLSAAAIAGRPEAVAAEESAMEKLDPSLSRLVEGGLETPQASGGVPVLIQLRASPDEATRAQLEGMGVEIRSVSGDIVSALVPSGVLPELTVMESVTYIEGRGRLTLE